MDLHHIAVRAAFAYLCLLALLRLSGKRTVSQSSTLDFVVALILGDLIDDVLWAEVPTSQFVVAAFALVFTHSFLSVIRRRSAFFSWLLSGAPSVLIHDGRPVARVLRAERINRKELAELMRVRSIDADEWRTVDRALLEVGGRITLLEKPEDRPAQAQDRDRVRELMR